MGELSGAQISKAFLRCRGCLSGSRREPRKQGRLPPSSRPPRPTGNTRVSVWMWPGGGVGSVAPETPAV